MIATLISWKDAAPAAAALTAMLSAVVALFVFIYTRKANRRRATLDMVMKTLLDAHSQERYSSFKKLIRKDKDAQDPFSLESLAEASPHNFIDRELVLAQLNIYEMTSLGIRRGLFEEGFYKLWFHGQFMTDYENSKKLIDAAQKRKGSVYCEFTGLYSRWNKSGHPVSNPNRVKQAFWILTGQNERVAQAQEWAKAR